MTRLNVDQQVSRYSALHQPLLMDVSCHSEINGLTASLAAQYTPLAVALVSI